MTLQQRHTWHGQNRVVACGRSKASCSEAILPVASSTALTVKTVDLCAAGHARLVHLQDAIVWETQVWVICTQKRPHLP